MYQENTCLHLPTQVTGGYDNRMHRMMRQPQPPPPPPPPPPTRKPRLTRNPTRQLNESMKPK